MWVIQMCEAFAGPPPVMIHTMMKELKFATASRRIVTVETPIGAVRFKVSRRDGRVMNAVPEFEDCATLAAANKLPVKEVQAIALKAYPS